MVSIIIPVYNAEKTLRKCLESVLAQNFNNYEVLLIDDGSKDGSLGICKEYADKDGRVIVIHKENGGVSAARNTGLEHMRGEYCVFVDSDDYVGEDYLTNLNKDDSDLTVTNFITVNENGTVLWKTSFPQVCYAARDAIDYKLLYSKNVLYSPYCKRFVSSLIKNNGIAFNTSLKWGEDGAFISEYLKYTNSITVFESFDYYYVKYIGNGSLSTTVREDIVDTVILAREQCVNNLKYLTDNTEDTAVFIINDIRKNCAYFVFALITNNDIPKRIKRKTLKKFLNNPYVECVVNNKSEFLKADDELYEAFMSSTANGIINRYYRIKMRKKTFLRLYALYCKLPAKTKSKIKKI